MESCVLDKVNITPKAYSAWLGICEEHIMGLAASSLPSDIPDEKGAIQADGSLLIYVDLPGAYRVQMRVEPDEWAWRQ